MIDSSVSAYTDKLWILFFNSILSFSLPYFFSQYIMFCLLAPFLLYKLIFVIYAYFWLKI